MVNKLECVQSVRYQVLSETTTERVGKEKSPTFREALPQKKAF